MRDPNLVEPRSATDLRVKPPHGRQTRVALGLELNGEDNNGGNAYNHPSASVRTAPFNLNYTQDVNGHGQEDSYGGALPNGSTASGMTEMVEPAHLSAPGRPQALQRARSDFGPRHRGERKAALVEEDLWRMRHGWEDEYTSNEYLALLNSVRSTTLVNVESAKLFRLSTCTILTRDMKQADYPRKAPVPTQTGA
jgi:hypothetical protein